MTRSVFGTSTFPFLLALALAGSVGCTQRLALIGDACKTSADCNSDNCGVKGVCTRDCLTQEECPVGFDCTLATAEAEGRTCNAAAYPIVESGGYGTSCTAELCTGAESPCAKDEGFFCYAVDGTKCSAEAACTRVCETDADCPYNFFCGENTVDKVKTKACLKRERCSDCLFDDECPNGFSCVEDDIGGRFCGQRCNVDDDCLKPAKGGDPFENCVNNICTPVTGACHGKSVLPAITTENSLCSPCRVGVPSDCGDKLFCYQGYSGERSCLSTCKSAIEKNQDGQYVAKDAGDCPSKLTCLLIDLAADCKNGTEQSCTGLGICTTDKTSQSLTCY
jgi:hypothetical protein